MLDYPDGLCFWDDIGCCFSAIPNLISGLGAATQTGIIPASQRLVSTLVLVDTFSVPECVKS